MINRIIQKYLEFNYIAQKIIGWKNSNDGLKNVIITHLFFISTGGIIFIFSFLKRLGFYFVLVYMFYYMFYLRINIDKKLDLILNMSDLNKSYATASLFKKAISVMFSILMLWLSIGLMIAIFIFLLKLKALIQ